MSFLEIQFSLVGKTLPADHGYALYSAVKQTVLRLLEEDAKKNQLSNLAQSTILAKSLPPEMLLCTIAGVPDRDGTVYLNQQSRFRLRCPSDQVQLWYRLLQNQVLAIRGHLIRLVQPRLTLPEPSATLKARLMTFHLEEWNIHEAPSYFLESCKKALDRLEIKAQPFIDSDPNGNLALRALQIRNKQVLGFSVVIEGLNEIDSSNFSVRDLVDASTSAVAGFIQLRKLLMSLNLEPNILLAKSFAKPWRGLIR